MDRSLLGSSVHGIFQARILEWVAIFFSGYLPDLGIKPISPSLAGRFFLETPGKPHLLILHSSEKNDINFVYILMF